MNPQEASANMTDLLGRFEALKKQRHDKRVALQGLGFRV